MWLLRFNLYRTYLLGISLCLPGTGLSDELLLLEAVEYNNVHVAEALLLDGADVNTRQADGATPLHWATHWDQVNLAKQLLEAGANVNVSNELGVAPISIACRNGSNEMVSLLLTNGADSQTREPSGCLLYTSPSPRD